MRDAWLHGKKAPCIVLPCGGGKSCIVAEMAKRTTDNKKRVLFLVHRKELCAQIENTFRRWGVDMLRCSVMMVQTASRRIAKLPPPSLIITDENHHSTANSYRKVYEAFPLAKRVGVTATPVRHSMEMAFQFNMAGIEAAHIDGSTPKPERERIIENFRRGAIDILCNVDLISEGFDVPDCECAILLRPTQSLTLYIQQAMRCMRYRKGKRAVIIDHVGNYARFGMPDAEHDWSLDERKRTKREVSKKDEVKIKECPECYSVFPAEDADGKPVNICPHCGYVLAKKESVIEQEEAELKKIEGFVLDYKTSDECRSMDELREYAASHGYKPGWAFYQAKKRGILS